VDTGDSPLKTKDGKEDQLNKSLAAILSQREGFPYERYNQKFNFSYNQRL